MPRARVDEASETIKVRKEACLSGRCGLPTASTVGLEAGQQRQADPSLRSCGDNSPGHFSKIRVARTVGGVVQIMELADCGETRLQHFDIGESGYGLDIIGRHLRQEPVHHVAPSPKVVILRTTSLGETSHC